MELVIFRKMLRNLSEKLVAKFPATPVSYSRVKLARLEDARLDLQPFWEPGCLSSFQIRLYHWSVALVRVVTSAFHANYYAGRHGSAGKTWRSLLLRKKCKKLNTKSIFATIVTNHGVNKFFGIRRNRLS